jgi:hypothetical protein
MGWHGVPSKNRCSARWTTLADAQGASARPSTSRMGPELVAISSATVPLAGTFGAGSPTSMTAPVVDGRYAQVGSSSREAAR